MIKYISRTIPLILALLYRNYPLIDIGLNRFLLSFFYYSYYFFSIFKKRRCISAIIWMIYKNYRIGKKLSGLEVYVSFFFYFVCLLLLSLLYFFKLLLLVFIVFCKLWRLVNGNCIFLYYFYFNLVGINQKYMLLACLLASLLTYWSSFCLAVTWLPAE